MTDKYDNLYHDLVTTINLLDRALNVLDEHRSKRGPFRDGVDNLCVQLLVRVKECNSLRLQILEAIAKESTEKADK